MKSAISFAVQFCVFVVVFLSGSLAAPFHLRWFVTQLSPNTTRFFVPDGLLLAIAAWLILLAVHAARRRLQPSAILTTAAFLLALIVGFAAKFGMVTHDLY